MYLTGAWFASVRQPTTCRRRAVCWCVWAGMTRRWRRRVGRWATSSLWRTPGSAAGSPWCWSSSTWPETTWWPPGRPSTSGAPTARGRRLVRRPPPTPVPRVTPGNCPDLCPSCDLRWLRWPASLVWPQAATDLPPSCDLRWLYWPASLVWPQLATLTSVPRVTSGGYADLCPRVTSGDYTDLSLVWPQVAILTCLPRVTSGGYTDLPPLCDLRWLRWPLFWRAMRKKTQSWHDGP